MSIRQWLSKAEQAEQAEAERLPPRCELESDIIFVLRTIYDPEIPVNIYDLGLIYGLDANPETGHVHLRMTLTAPGCPVAQTFPEMVANTVREVPGVEEVEVEMVWEPRWSKKMMSEAARLELGLV
ncbi:MAG: SUF system Fe-S cluster assembly protein [Dechloromonas sp.]|uniref:SUF system Fe-S cluster assembly protein n=1 Tax=Dechloromonas sp. TaxID=1917218 RepID=UPI0027E6E95E|nr:SUF system Fe-S cluster assembly protein [Dechloromonas sp.]MBT9520223.1 SUF system Fe-S cluster assembly protein [Dechloromonas sp.]